MLLPNIDYCQQKNYKICIFDFMRRCAAIILIRLVNFHNAIRTNENKTAVRQRTFMTARCLTAVFTLSAQSGSADHTGVVAQQTTHNTRHQGGFAYEKVFGHIVPHRIEKNVSGLGNTAT